MKTTDKKQVSAHGDLPAYTLIRADRRTMEIKVLPITGEIVIRIPRRTAQKTAEDFLRRNLPAISASVTRAKDIKPDRMHTELTDDEIRALKSRAAAIIPDRVQFWCRTLGVSLPDRISFTAAKQRFGSCRSYPDGRIHLCFSYRLMLFPDDAIDAVVLHEVAHIRHLDHSDAFYALIYKHMPDYDLRHAKLKQS